MRTNRDFSVNKYQIKAIFGKDGDSDLYTCTLCKVGCHDNIIDNFNLPAGNISRNCKLLGKSARLGREVCRILDYAAL